MARKRRIDSHRKPFTKRDPKNGCLLWNRGVAEGGYAYVWHGRERVAVHRLAYELVHGPVPAGQVVCHKCDVRHCVEPDHLFAGTFKDNMQDMVAKGRGRFGPNRGASFTKVDVPETSKAYVPDPLAPTLDEKVRRYLVLGVSTFSIAKHLDATIGEIEEAKKRLST